ncbi:MAG: PilZ domain-containing protein [Pseudomonadota bacterium]
MNKTFPPSTGVDIVFNMNSLAPYSRSSIIFDVDFDNQEITIAQPLIPFSKNTRYKELHMTTITQNNTRKVRLGITCTHLKIINEYPLANGSIVPAVKIKYELPIIEINIRSAFRLPLSSKFMIKGKILLDDLEYYSPRDFSIHDISLTGMGLMIPKKRGDRNNPLTELTINQELLVGVTLINMDLDVPFGTLPIKSQVERINHDYSRTHTLVGLSILTLKPDSETILNKFIHDAQIDELKRLSGRNYLT